MRIILKQTPAGKRAAFIEQVDLDKMLDDGTATLCVGYEIYEEVLPAEISQGYMTRNMQALPTPRKPKPPAGTGSSQQAPATK